MENSENQDLELEELNAVPADQLVEQPAAGEETPELPQKEKDSWQKTVLMYLHDIIYLLAAMILITLLFFRVVVVSGTSMNRTLLHGDYLLVLSNAFYQQPEYGDIVVISKESFDNGEPIVKRVIATEGQLVDIDFEAGIVYVDGVALDEPYCNTPTNTQEGMTFPVYVGKDCVFVMGDNRNVSRDSRSKEIGLVDEQEIIGRVVFLFLPGTNGEDAHGNPKENRDWSRIGVVK